MSSIAKAGRLAGKVAIVTGGGSGYGAGIARRFAEQGAKVVVADINEDGGRRTVEAMPDRMKFHLANVTKEHDWKTLVEVTQDAYGGIDCLVNNAGTTYRNKATKGLAAEFGPHQIRVNSICPLLGGTGLFESFSGLPDTPENRRKFLTNVPLGRLCEPSDVASACLFLASDESAFITGINMEVDGGRAV
ncbi:MAG: hypothetical protein Q9200_006664 [Gallowayella weberi]